MIVYQVSIQLDARIEQDWLSWMRDVHIPDVLATGFFDRWILSKVVEPHAAPGKVAYLVDYITSDAERLRTYLDQHAPALKAAHTERYHGRFTGSRVILQDAEGF